jgi:uncharacterized repeat protein (TIGR02543 family)
MGSSLADNIGTTIFNVSVTPSGLALARTSNPAVSGSLSFTINANSIGVPLNTANYQSSSTTIVIDNDVNNTKGLNITFANSSKPQSTVNNIKTSMSSGRNSNSSYIGLGFDITKIYNYLINNPNATQAQIEAAFPTVNFNQNIVVSAHITEATGHIVSVVKEGNTCWPTVFDILNSQTGLNGSYGLIPTNRTECQYQTVAIPDTASYAALQSILTQPGQNGSVKNSDGSWTYAVNIGSIFGSTLNEYPATASTVSFPNSAANNTFNQTFAVNAARNLQLAAEIYGDIFDIFYSDPTLPESANITTTENLFNTGNTTNTFVASDSPSATNQAAAQTTIKTHYVSVKDNAPLATVNVSYGWPSDNTGGNTATAPASVSPLATAPAGYQLITDPAALAKFANSHALTFNGTGTVANVASAVVPATTKVSYPTIASGLPQTDIYFVYAPIYNATFTTNATPTQGGNNGAQLTGAPSVSSVQVAQDDGTKTFAKPADPTLAGYVFAGWFTDNGTFAKPYDFSTVATSDIQLFAKWIPAYSLSFNTDGGTTVPTQNITQDDGTKIGARPSDPTKSGYIFQGWFTDDTFKTEFDFTVPVVRNTEVFAKFVDACQWNSQILATDQSCIKPLDPSPSDPTPTTPAAPNTGFRESSVDVRLNTLFVAMLIFAGTTIAFPVKHYFRK